METPIGRCSLCNGTVVKETGPWLGTVPPQARCTSCGATEAPPDKVIPMEKRETYRSIDESLKDRLAGTYAAELQRRALQDAVSQQFLPQQKPCPKCGPIPMGGQPATFWGAAGALGHFDD
jgi:Zn finger protein HypA/HybF involved in hydrogenase expression